MRVVLSAAIMDLCHEGHLNLLREMRKSGDYTIMVLHDDKACYQIKGKIPVQNIKQRVNNLKITGLIDKVLVTHSVDPSDQFIKVIKKYRNNLMFLRADDNYDFPGKWIIDKYSIPVKFIPYTKGISSTKLKKELCSQEK